MKGMVADLTLVFDLDGTLVDTAPDLVSALNVALRLENLHPLSLAAATNMIGNGTRVLLERGLDARARTVSAERFETLHDALLAHYTAHIADESRPYEGVEDTVQDFRDAGARLAVCTNKQERLSTLLLREINLLHAFDAVCGGDTLPVRKPDGRHLSGTIARAGGRVERAVMIGDSINDLKVARAAGVPVILVDFGYTEIPARDLGADTVISRFSDLRPALQRLNLA
jgi:phosphoglycolate phosphatase